MVDAAEPVTVLLFAQPIAVADADHHATQPALPALAVGAIGRERLPIDIGNAGDRNVAAVGRELGVPGNRNPETEGLARESEHHQDKVDANRPQKADEDDARETLGLENDIAEIFGRTRGMSNEVVSFFGVLDFDVGCIVLGAGKASG